MAMQKLGRTLQSYLLELQCSFSLKTVCQIGIEILHIFERLHSIGVIYNDLKMDNILVSDGTSETLHQLKLIDFGLATRYLDDNGKHIKKEKRKKFVGNLALSSSHAMKFNAVSRRDDLISLCYMLIYII